MIGLTRELYEMMATSRANQFKHPAGKNLALSAKRIEPTAEQKVWFEKIKADGAAADKEHKLYLQGKLEWQSAPPSSAPPAEDIYTKLGKMSSEERSTWIKNKLDNIAKGEAIAKELSDKYEKSKAAILAKAQANKVDTTA